MLAIPSHVVIDRYHVAQALASLILVLKANCTKVLSVGLIPHLLKILGPKN